MRKLLPQLSSDAEQSASTEIRTKCVQVLIGKKEVKEGKYAGEKRARQERCTYCVRAGRKFAQNRSRRTSYTCIAHKKMYMCKEGSATCWAEHVVEHENEDNSDDEGMAGDNDELEI